MAVTTSIRQRPAIPILFFALAFFLAWGPWTIAILIGNGTAQTSTLILLATGSFSPSLAGIALTYLHRGVSGPQEFWSRAFDPRRLTLSTGLLAVGFPLAVSGVVAILIWATGSAPFAVPPAAILGVALSALLTGSLNEELGWRGYALEPMQQRFGPGTGSAILGVIWAAFHLPLFFLAGSAQSGWGFGLLGYWAFAVMITANSVVIAAVYNRTRRSTLSGIGYHWAFNFSTTILISTPNMRALWAAISGVVAIVLLVTGKVGTEEGTGTRLAPDYVEPALEGRVI